MCLIRGTPAGAGSSARVQERRSPVLMVGRAYLQAAEQVAQRLGVGAECFSAVVMDTFPLLVLLLVM